MPHKPREIITTDAEKNASIQKGTADLKAWRERNPDAPCGMQTTKPGDRR